MSFTDFFAVSGEANLPAPAHPIEERYRLSSDDAFGQHQIIRLERDTDRTSRLVAHFANPGNSRTGATMEMLLEERHWQCLLALLEYAGFWKADPWAGVRGYDGAVWTIEGWKDGRSHKVSRWDYGWHDEHADFGLLGQLFIQIAYVGLRTDAPHCQWSRSNA
jgi:hypothetical protein